MTTETGARISINVGPSTGPQRKLSPLGRGCPPPIPPNKPQVFIPMSAPPPGRPPGAQDTAGGLSRLQPSSTKPGMTVLKDRLSSVAAAERIGSTVETQQLQHSMPLVRSGVAAAAPLSAATAAATGTAAHTNTSLHALSELSAERKPSPQLCVNIK